MAIHPSNPHYHLFRQDMLYLDTDAPPTVPYNRELYMKVERRITFDAAWTFACPNGPSGGYEVTKGYGNTKLFGECVPFTKEEAEAAMHAAVKQDD